jgi:mono/diheme cytochrome c family protein
MRTQRPYSLTVLCAVAFALEAAMLSAASANTPLGKQDKHARPRPASEGERVFAQNCSRCHTAPEGFPPSISGTIVRHMRVRASLSREDERAILKYLKP